MSLAAVDPLAAATNTQNSTGTTPAHSICERRALATTTTHVDPETRCSPRMRTMQRRRERARQRQIFRERLDLFKADIESTIFAAIIQWALRYAPEDMPFLFTTDFSRDAFRRLGTFRRDLKPQDIGNLAEMLWSLQLWAMGQGIDVEALQPHEFADAEFEERWRSGTSANLLKKFKVRLEGCRGIVGMFAGMVMCDAGVRAEHDTFTHATMAWREVILASMERSIKSMAIKSTAWQSRILDLVAERWMAQNQPEDRGIQLGYLERFLMKDVSSTL